MPDEILAAMAVEMCEALVARGVDPTDAPPGAPPRESIIQAFDEYKERGGTEITDAYDFSKAFVDAVVRVGWEAS